MLVYKHSYFSEPDGFIVLPVDNIKTKNRRFACLLFLVTPTGLEPMLPPWKGGVLTAWPTGRYVALFCADDIKNELLRIICMVAAMRFELMTYRVWTDRSNQLSYAAIWLRREDSNLRPSGYEPDELPSCSTPRCFFVISSGETIRHSK